MNAKACLAAAVLLVVSSSLADGAVMSRDWKTPGDGLLTYDTVSGREWLDFSPQLTLPEPRFDSVVAETGPGGMFEGFQVASVQDVLDLAGSAGVVIDSDSFVTNGQPMRELIDLIEPLDGTSVLAHLIGLTSDMSNAAPPYDRLFVILRYRATDFDPIADVFFTFRTDGVVPQALPVFLYRPVVPEPRLGLFGALLPLLWWRHRHYPGTQLLLSC